MVKEESLGLKAAEGRPRAKEECLGLMIKEEGLGWMIKEKGLG